VDPTPYVVSDADTGEAIEVPFAFVAVTVNVYVPAVSPVTFMVPAWDAVPVPPAGLEVAVYVVIGEPPSNGAVNVTVAVVGAIEDTAPMPGWLGAIAWVTVAVSSDATEVPAAFVAVALTVYAVPGARPVTSQDPDTPVTVHVPAAVESDLYAVTV
jgi:hypothetical protein